MSKKKNLFLLFLLTTIVVLAILIYHYGRAIWVPVQQKVVGRQTVSEVIEQHEGTAKNRLQPFFIKAGATYPPQKITLLALKDTNELELWAHEGEQVTFIRTYPIKAASGKLGPKLREGDRQVPEGIYSLEYLNPNSSYHLSMKINYPNEFDLKYAAIEGRTTPGTNIFIHGKAVSIGCLAMGDAAIEELFLLVTDTGLKNVAVAIAPTDPRKSELINTSGKPWVDILYSDVTLFFKNYL